MAENKTKETNESVEDFLDSIKHAGKRDDSYKILEMMKEITGLPPKMWGDAMIGFGSYHYKYKSGHEGDIFQVGFSPRKSYLSFYLFYGYKHHPLMKKLGKHKGGKACLNINKLADVDEDILYKLIEFGFQSSAGGDNPYAKMESC